MEEIAILPEIAAAKNSKVWFGGSFSAAPAATPDSIRPAAAAAAMPFHNTTTEAPPQHRRRSGAVPDLRPHSNCLT